MKCYIHTDRDAVAMCTSCNSTICEECRVMVGGKNVCKRCLEASSNSNFNGSQNEPTENKYVNNSKPSIDINMVMIGKLLTWVAIIFAAIKVLSFGAYGLNKVFNMILHLDFSLPTISWMIYDILFFVSFVILLLINLSKIIKISFINDDNIGALTILSLTLIGLAIIIVSLFTRYLGVFGVLDSIISEFSLLLPLVCSVVSIFGIYKHKININFTY